MTEAKTARSAAEIQPLARFTPEETARNKKARDERRKSIRHQNARSKSLSASPCLTNSRVCPCLCKSRINSARWAGA